MIDSHAHLHDSAYDLDRDLVVCRAKEAGVEKIITIGTSIEESRKAIACADRYEGVYASVGIHPNEIESSITNPPAGGQETNNHQSPNANHQEIISELRDLARHPKVVAIGECGLDYYSHGEEAPINSQQKTAQKELFFAQIELAKELNLPLIIHCRPSRGAVDAYEDILEILHNTRYKIQNTVLHCYMGDTEVTKKFLELQDVHFSFTGNITYPVKKVVQGTKPARIDTPARSSYANSVAGGRSVSGRDDLTETVKMLPLERMMIETDSPYLAPQEYRGKRNEPANVALIAEKIAEIKGISEEEVKKSTSLHAESIFGV